MTCSVCGFDWPDDCACPEAFARMESNRAALRAHVNRAQPSDDPHSPEFYAVGQTGVELMPAPELEDAADWYFALHDDVK